MARGLGGLLLVERVIQRSVNLTILGDDVAEDYDACAPVGMGYRYTTEYSSLSYGEYSNSHMHMNVILTSLTLCPRSLPCPR